MIDFKRNHHQVLDRKRFVFTQIKIAAIIVLKNRGVAQPGSVQRSGRWGRGFESHRPDT